MNSKTLIGVAVVVVIVVAVAAVAVGMGGGSEEKAPSGTVIIYDGNGGTYDGKTVEYSAISTVINSGHWAPLSRWRYDFQTIEGHHESMDSRGISRRPRKNCAAPVLSLTLKERSDGSKRMVHLEHLRKK